MRCCRQGLSWATWVAVVGVGGALAWFEFGGGFTISYHWFLKDFYGWPFLAAIYGPDKWTVLWPSMAADVVVVLVTTLATAFVIDRLRRGSNGLLQFRLASLLALMAMIGITLGLVMTEPELPDDFRPCDDLQGFHYGARIGNQPLLVRAFLYFGVGCTVMTAMSGLTTVLRSLGPANGFGLIDRRRPPEDCLNE